MSASLDPAFLRTFLAVIDCGSFSAAARALGISQPSVSDHIKRLEQFAGQQLFRRSTHAVALTVHGESMVQFARSIIEVNERARRHFANTRTRQTLRFGASEDLVTEWLPEILKDFTSTHPDVDIEFTIALSRDLVHRFDEGMLDLVICKRWPNVDRGEFVWRDPLVWVSSDGEPVIRDDEAQLVLYPPPALTRFVALNELERAGVPWRIACSSGSLTGCVAATRIGLGMMAHSEMLIPPGLVACRDTSQLPKLGELEFVLMERRTSTSRAARDLSDAIKTKASAAKAASLGVGHS